MSEDTFEAAEVAAAPLARTGVPLVDSILESVEAAAHLPVDEQVGVFERAHEQLRRALDAPTDQTA